ncbi:MAG: alpha-glucan family phosphorylase [Algoriphagus sp.]|jgi:starch phosphorylase|uniref:alpha-glucan family phosphorylase n=1 Tax=Algoriphagus sp. TaxID=1872435 RepID=UPI002715B170|nr:alpha-glucan family phosphorylase [Algoriphagus sp.]MDO8966570.1 alpha-glucan family phosphorylase [Algoriphagus sp.]MDP2040913.1 alpha-glucan family phosphorylase [Algoriphagus sp.]MDP3202016.1 alpha-glucan family phosphorylase [Algoriphagus sp.]MDP3473531.1 alpha-glucan family phosphorylase [Algoriphagus sp.]
MTTFRNYKVPYELSPAYSKSVAYFSMEFAIHQPLKIYSGGLGFLSGSHLRSAYELKQNLIGIGILWKYGYYDQGRNQDQTLKPEWYEKTYSFLEDTGIKFTVPVHDQPVWVKAWYLPPTTFNSAPLFLLSTDLPENDYLSQTITHRLYDADTAAKIAQMMILGLGGARLIDELNFNPDVYHLNEAHAVSSVFYLMKKFGSKAEVQKRLVFTTHTPEEAGNEKHDFYLCDKMSYFFGHSIAEVRLLTGINGDQFNHSLAALRFARKANGVSKLHGEVSRKMWGHYPNIPEIQSITNAQNWNYWADKQLFRFMEEADNIAFDDRKRFLKKRAFEIVADQTGKLLDPDILTIVWARRFAAYKRPEMITRDLRRFDALMRNADRPVQIIWAGKPYPMDYGAISVFNQLVHLSKNYKNVAVCVDYELTLSKRLKQASDIWLNNPRVPREASGTSGMTASMNGAINFSTYDGWICEFARHGENCFIIPQVDYHNLSIQDQDQEDLDHMFDILENQIIPMYYDNKRKWRDMVQAGMHDVRFEFESNRMAKEYYELMYSE